jgi:hypothetical protein
VAQQQLLHAAAQRGRRFDEQKPVHAEMLEEPLFHLRYVS